MKDILCGLLITLAIFILVNVFGEVEETPKRKQGLVQQPTLIEIPQESVDIEVGEDTEEIILSPQTGGFWVEILAPKIR
jgi:hypothetical protein